MDIEELWDKARKQTEILRIEYVDRTLSQAAFQFVHIVNDAHHLIDETLDIGLRT